MFRLRLLLLLPRHLQPDGDPGGVQLQLFPGRGGLLHLPHHHLSGQHLRGREIGDRDFSSGETTICDQISISHNLLSFKWPMALTDGVNCKLTISAQKLAVAKCSPGHSIVKIIYRCAKCKHFSQKTSWLKIKYC